MRILLQVLRTKLVVLLLLSFTAYAAFATFGHEKGKENPKRSLLSVKADQAKNYFSLRSAYSYRGNRVITPQNHKYINLNTYVTYQRGRTTYTVPIKKVILDNKVTFNPNAATRY